MINPIKNDSCIVTSTINEIHKLKYFINLEIIAMASWRNDTNIYILDE